MHLRLVSWNLHGLPLGTPRRAKRMRAAAKRIRRIRPRPDIVLFQEIWVPGDTDILHKHLGDQYLLVDDAPRRAFPPWFVPLLNLGGIFFRFRSSGLVAFVHRDWEIAGSGFEEFHRQDWEIKIWEGDGYADKGFQRLDLRHRKLRHRLCVFNTHMQALRREHQIRAAQVHQLAAAAFAVGRDTPVLIAGDFNVRPDEPLYDVATNDLRWIDLTRRMASCAESLGYTDAHGEKIARRRDYVFARRDDGWSFRGEAGWLCNFADDIPYSDHNGIVLDARIRRPPRIGDARDGGGRALAMLSAAAWRGPSNRRAWLLGALGLLWSGAANAAAIDGSSQSDAPTACSLGTSSGDSEATLPPTTRKA